MPALVRRLAALPVRLATLPRRLVRRLDDRFFGAVFQVTRVTNDDYGQPPPPPGGGEADAAPTPRTPERAP